MLEFGHLTSHARKRFALRHGLHCLLLRYNDHSKFTADNIPLQCSLLSRSYSKHAVFVTVLAEESSRIIADVLWSRYLMDILVKYAILLTQTRVNSTLGGAYASLLHIEKAARFARFQLYIASQLGDSFLRIKSLLHLAFYFIKKRKFTLAKKIIRSQRKKAVSMENETLLTIADAATLALKTELLSLKAHAVNPHV